MNSERHCPSCGKPVGPDAPQGLCPECLMKAGFSTAVPQESRPAAHPKFTPPTLEQMGQLFPKLEVLTILGHGGMGAVYKARQPDLDRLVAVKVLPPESATDPGFAGRFSREARALAKLNHPNIVAVHEFGSTGGLHYFIMEYVDGCNLRELQRQARIAPEQALRIIPQICEALEFAHSEGVVHRDVKPENVMLDKKGRVKITDFGLAKILGLETRDHRLTGARDVMGTPHYMAPEQVEQPQNVDHRADIYSLGVVFYELLTGELPLGRFAPPSRKVQVDVRLDDVVLHALEKEPERRYQRASQVKKDVETISATPPPPPAPSSPSPKWSRALRVIGSAVAAGLVTAIAIFGVAAFVTLLMPAEYAAEARVLLHDADGRPLLMPEAQQTALERLRSPALATQLTYDRQLRQRLSAVIASAELSTNELNSYIQKRLVVEQARQTALVTLQFIATDPALAADVANAAANAASFILRPARVAIVQAASPPSRAIRPNVPLNLFVGATAGIGAGLVVAILTAVVALVRGNRAKEAPGGGASGACGTRLAAIQAGTFVFSAICFTIAAGFAKNAVQALLSLAAAVGFSLAAYRRWLALSSGAQPSENAGRGLTRAAIAARWMARISGTVLLLFYTAFAVGEGVPPLGSQPVGVQMNFAALGLMLAGFVLGWRSEGVGALSIALGWTLWQISENAIRLNLFQTPLPVALLYSFVWWSMRPGRTARLAGAAVVLLSLVAIGRLFSPTNVFVLGTVVDQDTRLPVPKAELTLLSERSAEAGTNAVPNSRADQHGRFTLYIGWYDPNQKVMVSASGYETLRTPLGARAPGQRCLSRMFKLVPKEAR